VKVKLDENLPISSAAILTGAGHDADTSPKRACSARHRPIAMTIS
jgi:hypothetical protein